MKNQALNIFKNRPKYSNCFVDYKGFIKLIDNESYQVYENNIFILKEENGVYKFLYFIDNLSDISNSLCFLEKTDKIISLEYVAKNTDNIPNFFDVGFSNYKVFSRYSVLKNDRIPPKLNNAILKLPNKEDSSRIFEIANEVFDPLCDYIPSIEEINKFIDEKEIYIIKNKEIMGYAIYKKTPYGYDFRTSCVVSKYRASLVGYNFVANLPNDGNRCTCWVDDSNLSAIRLNESIGFKKDGLKNYIFVRNLKNGEK